ncbi:MAG: nucleoside-triphosphatase [Oscillospiraceae bacterium]|nr:nucleoside-triphosphatase [Oscillospiraceae bacterium]
MHTLIVGRHDTNRGAFIDRLLGELDPAPRLYGYRSVKETPDETGNAPIYIYPASGTRYRTRDNLLGWCRDRKSKSEPAAFARNACLIEDARPEGLLVMDEIGPMESKEPRFSAAVLDALDGDTPILASVRDIDIPFLEAVRGHSKARCFFLTKENAKTLFPEALAHLRAQLERAR